MRRLASVLAVLAVAGLLAPTASAAFVTESAELAVEQPHYIDGDVTTSQTNGTTTYEGTGDVIRIQPQNFDTEDVTEFGIATSGTDATLSYNRDMDQYELRSPTNGTLELYWVATELREVDNESQEVDIRYTARVRVQQSDIQHVEAGTLDQFRSDAANWSAFESKVLSERVAGPGANIDEEAQTAINLLRLKYHPFSALTGEFTGLLLTLFITLPGLVIVLLAVGGHLASRRRDITEQRRRRQLDAERADLEDELDAIEEHDRLSALEGMDWNDIPDFDDATARAFREHLGETVLDGWLKIEAILKPETLVRDRLQAMADSHVAVRGPETDGGTAGESGSWRLVPQGSDAQDRASDVQKLTNPDDDLVDALDWDDPELREFDLTESDISHGLDIDRLVEEVDINASQAFEDEEMFAEYLQQFLQTVVDHEYTDHDGRVRPMRHALNLWLRTLRYVGEREGVPTARYSAEHVESLLNTYDTEDQIADWVNRVETGQGASNAD